MIQMIKLLTLSCFVLLVQQCHAQELTGSKQNDDAVEEGIIGQIKVTGEIPVLVPLVSKAVAPARPPFLANAEIPDESLLVSKDGGIANVFIYLKKLPEGLEIPKVKRESSLLSKGCRFRPHAQIVSAGRPFLLINQDPIDANFHIYGFLNVIHNYVLEPHHPDHERPTIRYRFKNPETLPVQAHSNFHPWMKAWVLPLDHPFAAVTDKNGNFTIQGLPPGTYEFRVWHERVGMLEKSLSIEVVQDKPTRIQLAYPVERF